jgi:beta-lactamase regulating signal transducer with metallopeptidase domain
VLWTGFVWLAWQLMRKCIRFTAQQIYVVNTALQLLAALGLVMGGIYFVQYDATALSNLATVVNLTQYLQRYPLLAEALLLLYLLALGMQLAQWLMGLVGVSRLMRSGVAADANLMQLLAQQQAAIDLQRTIALRVSEAVDSPLTIGWLKPVIILPMAAINQLTVQEMNALLLHELVHIRRYDYLVNHALVLSRALLCFNPFIWLLHEETVLYREISCDDAVRSQQDTTVYAGALFRMAQWQQQHRLAMAATGSKDGLRKRIAYMLEPMQAMQTSVSRIMIVVFGLGALALLLFFSARTAKEKRISKRKPKTSNTKLYTTPKAVMAKTIKLKPGKQLPQKRLIEKAIVVEESIVTNTHQPAKMLKTWSDMVVPVVEERILTEGNPLLKQVAGPTEKQVLQEVLKTKLVSAADLLKQLKQDKVLTKEEKLWLIARLLQQTGIQFDANNQIILPEGVDIQALENMLRNRNLLLRERVIPDSLLQRRIQ